MPVYEKTVWISRQEYEKTVKIDDIPAGKRLKYGKICVGLEELKGVDKLPVYVALQLRVSEETTPATYVYVYKTLSKGEEACEESSVLAAPDFKELLVKVTDGTTPWDLPEWEAEIKITATVEYQEEKPPEQPPEQPPEKPPEKPSEPFDLGKWIEWGLRNILRDEEPPTCKPHNTWFLAVLLTIIYLNTLADIDWWIAVLGLTPLPTILFGEPWRIFTYMWLHYPAIEAVNEWTIPHAHLAFNVLFLWVFGDNVECRLGAGKFFGYYIVLGIVAGLGQVAWLHIIGLGWEPIIIIGASGAISGLMGLYLVLFPNNNVVFMGKQMKAYWFLILWFLGQVAMLFQLEITVGVAAHIVGFLTGVGLGCVEKYLEETIG